MIARGRGGRPLIDRSFIYEMLDPLSTGMKARVFRYVHHLVVLVGVAAVIAGTSPSLSPRWHTGLDTLYQLTFAFFVLEYLVRLQVAPLAPWMHPNEPWRSRLHWAMSLHGFVDLVAVAPFMAAVLAGVEPSLARLLCIVWVLKLAPYSEGILMLARVIRHARQQILSVLIAFIIILLSAGTLQYVLEREAQPDAFGSIPSALWWTIVTLTTTGYGDAVPSTFLGRILAGFVMVCGIGLFALWAGILASTFADEIRRREFLRTWDLVAKVPFFRDIGAATIADMTRLLRPREVAAGSAVVRRGQAGDCMYFVVEGEVEIQLDPPVKLGPGHFFGEIALITGTPRVATVLAVRSTVLLALDLVDFRDLAARRPELTKVINEEAARRIGMPPPRVESLD
jgi:voltage-gated potassium channel